mmetsp:Transcript_78606/g.244111  ORF Transcript_78606/g.244111 Transcript_78606/m.244111 type:complete len:589 (+) Transcript_78606:184-1950(+)
MLCTRPSTAEEGEVIFQEALTFHRTSNPAYITKIANGNKEGFVRFIKGATSSTETQEYAELHGFLFRCFNFADGDFDGLVNVDDFNMMVERAASLPRMFGFAPTSIEMFKSPEACREERAKMFKQLGPDDNGLIGFDKWLKFTYSHICEKAKVLDKMFPSLAASADGHPSASPRPLPRLGNFDRASFKTFLIAACKDKTSMEYKELYRWLQQSFSKVDSDQDGRIAYAEFDTLVNITAAEPRRLGFAPSIEESYKSQVDKIEGRQKMFKQMDVGNTGFIGFDAFLSFMYTHISNKVKDIEKQNNYKACQCTFVPEQPDRTADVMPMDKESFVVFTKRAASDREGPEYATLYRFLLRCFNEADTDFDGKVMPNDFDTLVERAAVLPRMFGFAPTSQEMFKSVDDRKLARSSMFKEMDVRNRKFISFDDWLDWSYAHICKKAAQLDLAKASRKLGTFTKAEFAAFIIKATEDRKSIEYKELYRWLLDCFREADKNKDGLIGPADFDVLVDLSAAEPRRLGFAPKASELFSSKEQKAAARKKMFDDMDTEKSGLIGFHHFLNFTYSHICEKAKQLPKDGAGSSGSSGCVVS